MTEKRTQDYTRSKTDILDKWGREEDRNPMRAERKNRPKYQINIEPKIKRRSKTYHLDPATIKSLDAAAEKYGLNASRIIDQIVEDYIDRKGVLK